jgi:SH3-like domain-containing protein
MRLLGIGILVVIVIVLGTFNLIPNRPDVERTSTQINVAPQNAEFAPEILFSPTSRTLSVTSSPLAVATNPLVTSTVSKTILTTKARNVALRAGPHINHPGVSKNYDKGTPMEVLGTHNGWYFVIAPDGAKGWLYEEWLNIDLADLTNIPLITIIPTAPLNTRIPPDRESEPGPGPQETLSNPYP